MLMCVESAFMCTSFPKVFHLIKYKQNILWLIILRNFASSIDKSKSLTRSLESLKNWSWLMIIMEGQVAFLSSVPPLFFVQSFNMLVIEWKKKNKCN